MGRRIESLTLRTLDDLPLRCRGCVHWELSPLEQALAMEHDPEFEKEAWCSAVSLETGTCGRVIYVDDVPAGYALAAMPENLPRAEFFPARVSKDAYLLATMHVLPEFAGQGIGKTLIQAVLKDAKEHGKRALECFADRQWTRPECMIPAEFCERVGFKVKRDHPRFPLMRIDVRSLAKVAETMEAAMEAFLESVRIPSEPAPRPAGR
ncbi:MAG: GNAT family N-acetyltransferase [Actinomycetota bacterium]|nr:GNAT family N-acetyltransferase [Actinomycetota bacterium]